MKKICAACLALLVMSHTALAADLTVYGEESAPPDDAVPANEAVISVRVPDTGWVLANPYGMEVERSGVVSSEQIVSSTIILENLSAVPVHVGASAAVTVQEGSDLVFVRTPPAQDSAAKEAFIYAEFRLLYDLYDEPVWSGYYDYGDSQLPVTSDGDAREDVMTLQAGGEPYSVGAMRVFGSMPPEPAQPWSSSDAFTVKVVFSFSADGADESLTTDAPEDNETDADGPSDAEEPSVGGEPAEEPDAWLPDADEPDRTEPEETVPDQEADDPRPPSEEGPYPDEIAG